MKTYLVKEILGPTIEGEGEMVGTPVTILRLSGCNMWDGRPQTRAKSVCPFCDTQFRGGERMTAHAILQAVSERTKVGGWVSITGGEPTLQYDANLHSYLSGFNQKIETNGSKSVSFPGVRVVLSPKVERSACRVNEAWNLKVLWRPGHPITPESYRYFPAAYKHIQVVTDDTGQLVDLEGAVREAIRLGWKVSVQTHRWANYDAMES